MPGNNYQNGSIILYTTLAIVFVQKNKFIFHLFLKIFVIYCKLFIYFVHAWPHSSKILVSTYRKL